MFICEHFDNGSYGDCICMRYILHCRTVSCSTVEFTTCSTEQYGETTLTALLRVIGKFCYY